MPNQVVVAFFFWLVVFFCLVFFFWWFDLFYFILFFCAMLLHRGLVLYLKKCKIWGNIVTFSSGKTTVVLNYVLSTSSGSFVLMIVILSAGLMCLLEWNYYSLKIFAIALSPKCCEEWFLNNFFPIFPPPLVSRVHSGALNDKDVISREDHELETEKLELEIQQCKEMIKTQQQLLQVAGFKFCYFQDLWIIIIFNVTYCSPLSFSPFIDSAF